MTPISCIERRLSRAYMAISSVALAVLATGAFRAGAPTRIEELTVERINVVERDGTLRLVIANRARSPGGMLRGKEWNTNAGTRGGLIFFNEEGSEAGGLVFSGKRLADGTYYQGVSLTMDRFEQDQTVALQHYEESGGRFPRQTNALTIFDRPAVPLADVVARRRAIDSMPDGPRKVDELRNWREMQGGMEYAAPRVYVGRAGNRSSLVNLYDPQGRPRLRLVVDTLGRAAIEFLNDSGRVVRTLDEN